ncbi:MAG: DNA alkylation repair protein [Actinomycetota bacterium]|nr:DNA alkylation repair protein [Actinomycetota bacterium]
MADLKDEVSVALAGRLARELAAAWPGFPRRQFTQGLGAVLDPLALMARVEVLTDRLVATLPEEFPAAAHVLSGALESPTFTGWMTLACGYFVARAGIDQPAIALPLLAALTPRWSSEAAIRPFIEHHERVTYQHLHRWVTDPDEHVRRLVSEGTRPRLPWAPRLRRLMADPTPNIRLLERLVEDPSAYVRRSVANHLNDIAKDHPDTALDLARQWQGRGEGAAWIVRHGLRTLVKRGEPDALRLLGYTTEAPVALRELSVDREVVAIGDEVAFRCVLELDGAMEAETVIDYRVHYVGANGPRAPKVFKLTHRRLVPGEPVTVTGRHSFKHVSIRQIRAGRHTIDVQVNGRVLGAVAIEVVDTPRADDRRPSAP